MAEPNPDDGLVPDISELYKRNPAEWHREAKKRTMVDATMEKLEKVEASLDGDNGLKDDTNDDKKEAGNGGSSAEAPKAIPKEARTSGQAENIENGREAKRSKLSSRK